MTADLEKRLVLAQTAHNLELLENDRLTTAIQEAVTEIQMAAHGEESDRSVLQNVDVILRAALRSEKKQS